MKKVILPVILAGFCSISNFVTAPLFGQKPVKGVAHSIIYHQPGRFAGWPANSGAFIFDNNEILVGFTEAKYKLSNSHNSDGPYNSFVARSLDGGTTWTYNDPENFVGDLGKKPELKKLPSPINFTHPEFVMRFVGDSYHGADDGRGHFFYSYDKGKSWQGPYTVGDMLQWPEFANTGLNELSPRTDYVVKSNKECLLFFSIRTAEKFGSDRLFCVKTVDGGQSFTFQGWVVPPASAKGAFPKVKLFDDDAKNPYAHECRAVMSQTLQVKDKTIVTTIRRKYVTKEKEELHWIDAYSSNDDGKTWTFTSKIADTGASNGNPPAMALTKDGRLCVVYGERDHGTIRVVYSKDKGKTWSAPQILMDGFWSEDMELNDLGYPRVVCRQDGKMVAMYYYSTKEHLHHLRATVWKP